MFKNCPKCSKIVQNVQKLSKMFKNCQKCKKIVKNGNIGQNCPLVSELFGTFNRSINNQLNVTGSGAEVGARGEAAHHQHAQH